MGHELRWSGDTPWIRKSCLEDWFWCPWKFKHVWIDENYAEPNRAMVVGTRFHEFAEIFFDYCGAIAVEDWIECVPVDTLQPDEVEMWCWFVEMEQQRYWQLLDAGRIEEFQPIFREFKMENPERYLESTCDRADWECKQLGMVSLIEYKTGEKINKRSLERQLAFYSILWTDTLGIGDVTSLKLINPRMKVVQEIELKQKVVAKVLDTINLMRWAIEHNEYNRRCTQNMYPYCRVCTPQESGAFRVDPFEIKPVDEVVIGDWDLDEEFWGDGDD